MGFSTDGSAVRVDLFKPSGKWSETIAISGANYRGCIHDSVKDAVKKVVGNSYAGYTAVCLEPCHEYSHPVSFIIKE